MEFLANEKNKKVCIFAGVVILTIIVVFILKGCNSGKNKDIKEIADGEVSKAVSEDVAEEKVVNNETMIQYFDFTYPNDGSMWNLLKGNASDLAEVGITSVWMPPACKADGSKDTGYSIYDLYDLGEFNQKGTVRTKYGTKDEYLAAIKALHDNGIKAYADIVLDHKTGADTTEIVSATRVNGSNRNQKVGTSVDITSWTVYNFPGRNNTYSDFKWDATCFDGVDWDDKTRTNTIFLFDGKTWDKGVNMENGNYDYLLGSDVDFENEKVVEELKSWGKWYVEFADLDGFRLDAVKHISFSFFPDWLKSVRESTGRDLFSVGEYWNGDVKTLENYIKATGETTTLFDVALHYNFEKEGKSNGTNNLSTIFQNTLVNSRPDMAVTFVDNHDTQRGQSLASEIAPWFKPLAYCMILTREGGIPCVYYADYYGSSNQQIPSYKDQLDKMLIARKDYAYGTQKEYLNGADVVGWTRMGDNEHKNSGLAAIISDNQAGELTMNVGENHAGETWYDITGNQTETVVIGSDGEATFKVGAKSYSIYVNNGDKATKKADNTEKVSEKKETEAPKATEKPAPGPNDVVIYYKNTFSNCNIHYCTEAGQWTEVPGVPMEYDSETQYYTYTVTAGSVGKIACCFNDGNDTWDNNGGGNYTLTPGIYTINNGVLKEGAPN
ncbi:MAG: alpha-amylase [Lachnospiraceae bacterium]|nr:alpha-amylase [Lachnospiraceae bacterium]